MPIYSRKAYIQIGKVLRNSIMTNHARAEVCRELSKLFAYDNPNFDAKIFRELVMMNRDDDIPHLKGTAKDQYDLMKEQENEIQHPN